MAEATTTELGLAQIVVSRIVQSSPLQLEVSLPKLPKELAWRAYEALKILFRRLYYGDLERKRRQLEIEDLEQDVLRKRLENWSTAVKLAEKIPDPALRGRFLQSVDFSVRPFLREHPPLLSVEVVEDEPS
jgi:hypothetical protein